MRSPRGPSDHERSAVDPVFQIQPNGVVRRVIGTRRRVALLFPQDNLPGVEPRLWRFTDRADQLIASGERGAVFERQAQRGEGLMPRGAVVERGAIDVQSPERVLVAKLTLLPLVSRLAVCPLLGMEIRPEMSCVLPVAHCSVPPLKVRGLAAGRVRR